MIQRWMKKLIERKYSGSMAMADSMAAIGIPMAIASGVRIRIHKR